MKNNLDYLPSNKQTELSRIIALIQDVAAVEMIILFGSYARNDWVEEKYNEKHYRYKSDFDVLVIVETKSESLQNKLEREIEEHIEQDEAITTPTSIIVHDIDFVNRRLAKAQYFFTDLKKEGVILYDSEKFRLKEPKELNDKERYQLAKQDFEYWFDSAQDFFDSCQSNFKEGRFAIAAFELHQVAERLYSGILLVFTRYKPNTHDLAVLRKIAHSVDNQLGQVFPLDTVENKRLFKLLRKAYVDARYKPSYVITPDELLQLSQQVQILKKIGQSICVEKINQLQHSCE